MPTCARRPKQTARGWAEKGNRSIKNTEKNEDVRRSEEIIRVGLLSDGHIKSPAASWPVVETARKATGNS